MTQELQDIQLIFNNVQLCDTKIYSNCLKEMKSKITENRIQFNEEFIPVLTTILLSKKKDVPQKIMLFLKNIIEEVIENENGHLFVEYLFFCVVKFVESKNKKVRKNSLILINLILQSEIEEDKFIDDKFLVTISERLFDKEGSVRQEAIKVLAKYQLRKLNERTLIINIFKDIMRHDASSEVRKVALKNILIIKESINAVIERCADVQTLIRKFFFTNCLSKIELKELPKEKRIFILKRAFYEREFDAKVLFLNKCFEEFNFKDDIIHFVYLFHFEDSNIKEDIFEKLLILIFEAKPISFSFDKEFFRQLNCSSSFFMKTYFVFQEKQNGRDSLVLPPLADINNSITLICKKDVADEEARTNMLIVKDLFQMINFYDVFADEAIKNELLSSIINLTTECLMEDVIDQCVRCMKNICSDELKLCIESIINKIAKCNKIDACLVFCKYVMKHLTDLTDIHEKIIQKIIIPNINIADKNIRKRVIENLYFYLFITKNEKFLSIFVENIRDIESVFEMCVDLFVFSENYRIILKEPLFEYIDGEMLSDSVSVIIPISKILLIEKSGLKIENMLKFIIIKYYETENDYLRQFLIVYLCDYFKTDSTLLINIYVDALNLLKSNQKVFIDQSLYWIKNSTTIGGTQTLFYKICVYLIKAEQNCLNLKFFMNVLEKIDILNCWERSLTKKILFCCSTLIRRSECKGVYGDLLEKLMSIDDGEPIDKADLAEVKHDLGF